MDWDDLKLALTVAERGSLVRAGRSLGIAHTTVARRLAQLERDVGGALFERDGKKLAPTAKARALLLAATEFDRRLTKLADEPGGADSALEGLVTVTTVELLAGFLAEQTLSLRGLHPALALRVRVGADLLDLAKREADIAVRVNPSVSSDLVGRRVAHANFAIYGVRKGESWQHATWVCFDDDLKTNPQARWEAKHVEASRIALRTSSRGAFVAAVRAGVGVGILPCAYADADARFVKHSDVLPSLRVPVWVLMHRSASQTRKIRVVADFLTDRLRKAGSSS
jgi:DNA-binding transcriptional LysR family regulator